MSTGVIAAATFDEVINASALASAEIQTAFLTNLHPPLVCAFRAPLPNRNLQMTLIPAGALAQPVDRDLPLGRLECADGGDTGRGRLERPDHEIAPDAAYDGVERVSRNASQVEAFEK